uniref:Uncharacterized protein n=1 Tax=Anopheles maculatus TaxID=74869 RepID=A0A182STT0_9DIPT
MGPFPVLLSGSSSLMVSAVVDETDEPPDEGGVEGVEDDDDDSEDEEEDEDDEDDEDEEDGVGGANVGVEGVGGSSIAVGLFPSPPPVPLGALEELLLRRFAAIVLHAATTSDRIIRTISPISTTLPIAAAVSSITTP